MPPLRRSAWSSPQGGGPVGAGCGLLLGLLIGTYWFLADESPQWPILAVGLDLAALTNSAKLMCLFARR